MHLQDKGEWVGLFNPRDATIFVPTDAPPAMGTMVRLDLVVGEGGPKIIFRGKVIARRLQGDTSLPRGCNIALGRDEREKINYLNGFVRGGLLNLRDVRRIPVRLRITYGGIKGAVDTFTRDINDEGVFVIAEDPLPEDSEIHLFAHFPGHKTPVSLSGSVAHTVVVEDEDIPGMGIRFVLDGEDKTRLVALIDELEKAFLTGQLGDEFLI